MRTLNKDGSFNIDRQGVRTFFFSDFYHFLIRTSWSRFFALILCFYLSVNLLFALVYYSFGVEAYSGMRTANREFMEDCFFFSVQTLATIGYGRISPVTFGPNLVVTIEALLGLLMVAAMTGIFFARFSRPTAKVAFSHVALITEREGNKSFVFRLANQRLNQIVEAHLSVIFAYTAITKEGERFRYLKDLKLNRDTSPLFALTWTVEHLIDDSSPLYKLSPEELAKMEAEIIVTLTGTDENLAQMIHARHSYIPEEIIWNRQYQDILSRSPGQKVRIDIAKLHELKPL